MTLKIILFLILTGCSYLMAEEAPIINGELVRTTVQDSIQIHTDQDSLDIFIDRDGDGIADNRNFRERNRNWHQNLNISKRMFGQKQGFSGSSGQTGKKAKQGNHGGGGHGGG